MAGALTAAIAAAFSGGAVVVTDPYFEYTTLLLPGSGTNGAQNNTFLDGSTNNFTITRNGNTTQGTFSPFSQTGWGNYFDGTGDYLSVAANAAFDLGSTDFTVEAWAYFTSFTSTNGNVVISKGAVNSVGADFFSLQANPSGVIQFYFVGGTPVLSGSTLSANTWYHLAVTRSGNTFTLWVNGNSSSTTTSSATLSSGGPCIVGSQSYNPGASDRSIYGYISNARIVKGVAVYTGAFTPPTSPLAATQSAGTNIAAITGTQTSLLTCQSNRFIDNSTNNFTITRNGDTRVVAFSPFNPTASWSAAAYGGSGYFDGSGDYLSVAYNSNLQLGSSDFTIEFWFYGTVAQGNSDVFLSGYTSGTNLNYLISVPAGNDLKFYASTTGNSWAISGLTIGTLITSQWNHIAITRSGSTVTTYLNGTVGGTSTALGASAIYANTAPVYIGAAGDNPTGFNPTGYFSGVRIVKGTAITPPSGGPTSPPTDVTNTQLLLNFTNAGIYDATSKNDLETVGNAQISTTQSKWGGSSISFDGTGDWLLIPDQPPQRIGTGNFTIEMWVYRNSSGTYGLAGKGTGTTGWLVSLNSSNQVVFTYGSSTITSSGTISATTWTHIAVVREGTSTNQTKIYIGGSNDGTGTVSTDFNQTNSMYIGADRTGGSAANAYVQDVRITNYARYTSNFTPPTAAFPTL